MSFIRWLQKVVEAVIVARERARDAVYDSRHKRLARLREINRDAEKRDSLRAQLNKEQELINRRMFGK